MLYWFVIWAILMCVWAQHFWAALILTVLGGLCIWLDVYSEVK